MPIDIHKTVFLDSAQATVKDLTTGYARFILSDPFGSIPDAQIAAQQFSFTNWFVNVSAALGNNKLYYSDDALDETKYTITIPDGSYSINDLNSYVSNYLKANHAGVALFTLTPNYPTNKIGIQFGNVVGWYVHFDADSPYTLLGFANPQNVPVGKSNVAYYIEYGGSTAAFNNITNLKVWINLTSDSISNSSQSNIILTTVPIVEVGSTQTTQIYTLLWMESTPLRDKITNIEVRILDQLDRPLLLSEDFTLTLLIKGTG